MLKVEHAQHEPGIWNRWVYRIPVVIGIYAVASGVLTLAGWIFEVRRLMDWNNSGITMKANTAVCVVLLGLALIFTVKGAKYAVLVFAGAALLITLLTLSQYVFGVNLGIDTLLFDEPPGSPATFAPGRMGLPAITTFTLLGTALLFSIGSTRLRHIAGWLGVAALTLSSLPLVGYLYGASQFYSVTRLTGIAFQTATIIAALAIGVIAAIREFGLVALMEGTTAGAVMFRRLALPLALASVVIGWARVLGQEAGLYDTAFGTAARTIVEIIVVTGLLWWTARGVNDAEESLREADRRKDEFIATLSHELRNPLAPIRNAVQVLRESKPGSPDVAASREMIERQVAHMARLIDDLLDVGRITRNKIELRKEPLEIGSFVQQAIDTCRPLLDKHRHRLTIKLPEKKVYLDADPVRLTQIIGNLINNACKFTPDGGRISVNVDATESSIILTVSDDGVGIPADRLGSVFALFTQVDSRRVVDHSGLGIGLNLTKHFVELHDGRIEAKSDGEGQGSSFIVTLPRLAEEFAPVETETAARNGNQPRRRRILLVDDNQDALESLRLIMEFAGNETATASDGLGAVEQARVFRPEIVLLDIGLPHLDGYEVCRLIRQETWGPDAFIVALTGWGQDEDRRQTREAGFDAHLVKPVDPTVLLDLVAAQNADANASKEVL